MSDKKLVVVFGSTGYQGGSVVESLLKDGKYKIRALTRNPSSEKAKKLSKKGVEVFKADNTNPEQIKEALKGAYAAFVVTNFWDKSTFGKEDQVANKIVDIAKEQDVKHFIYSSLVNTEKQSKGKYKVQHFTQKSKVEEYAKKKGFQFTTFPCASFYFTNFTAPFNLAKKDKDGVVVFEFPVKKETYFTAFDPNETGDAIVEAINNPEKYNGEKILYVGTHATIEEYVETFKKVTGEKAKFVQVTEEEYSKKNPFGGKELAEMFLWFQDYTYYGDLDLDNSKKASKLSDFSKWIKKSGWRGQKKEINTNHN